MRDLSPDPILGMDDWITCPRCRVMRLLSETDGCQQCRKSPPT